MKKKILICLSLCTLLFTGCAKEKKTVTWYVDEGMFLNGSSKVVYNEPIDNTYIRAYNKVLDEKGYDFQIEVQYYDSSLYRGLTSNKEMVENIKKDHPDADVVDFNLTAIDEFEVLDEYFETEVGKKLKEEIHPNSFEKNKQNGKTYSIEKMAFKYKHNAYSFLPEYYESHKEIIETNKEDPIALVSALGELKEWNNEFLLSGTSGFDIAYLLNQKYQSIRFDRYESGFFVRRSDHKVVSIFDDAFIEETILMLAEFGKDGAYGRTLKDEELSAISQNSQYAIELMPYDYPDELYPEGALDHPLKRMKYGIDFISEGGQLGVLKSSDMKQEAFESIALMYIDKDAANAMIYGEDVEYKDGFPVSDQVTVGGTWNSHGNYFVADRPANVPANIKEIAYDYLDSIDMSEEINPSFQTGEHTETLEKLMLLLNDKVTFISINMDGLSTAEIKEKLAEMKKECEDMKIGEMREFLQQQLDGRYV